MVAHQGKAPGGELHPDLVAASGVEPHTDQGAFPGTDHTVGQPGLLDAAPLPLDHEDLILGAVLPQKVV